MNIQYALPWLRVNHCRRLLILKGCTLLFNFLLVLNQYTTRTAPGLEAVATYSSAEAITFAQIGSLACENQTVEPTALSYGIKTALEEIYKPSCEYFDNKNTEKGRGKYITVEIGMLL